MDSIKVILAALCCIAPLIVIVPWALWALWIGKRMCIMPATIEPPTEKPKVSPPPPPPGPEGLTHD